MFAALREVGGLEFPYYLRMEPHVRVSFLGYIVEGSSALVDNRMFLHLCGEA